MAAQNATATKAELISGLVQKELLDSVSLAGLVTDLSHMAMDGYESVSVPKMSSFTVQDRGFGATAADNAPLTDDKDVIALDKNKIVKWNYDAADAKQSAINWQIESAKRAATAHGREVNKLLLAEFNAVAGLSVNAAVPADITASAILDMREFIMKNEGDLAMTTLVIAPDQEKVMLTLPEFSRYDYNGQSNSPLINGVIGRVYGINVVVSNDSTFPSQQGYMVEKSSMAIAIQRAAKYGEQPNIDYGVDGVKAAVDMTFGLGALQKGENGVAVGETPLLAKLRD